VGTAGEAGLFRKPMEAGKRSFKADSIWMRSAADFIKTSDQRTAGGRERSDQSLPQQNQLLCIRFLFASRISILIQLGKVVKIGVGQETFKKKLVAQTQTNWNRISAWLQHMELLRQTNALQISFTQQERANTSLNALKHIPRKDGTSA